MYMEGCFFTADYRDGQVYCNGKKYPAGHFAVQLMNQYYVHDTAARISVFRDSTNGHVLEQLRDGYLHISQFVRAGFWTEHALKAIPRLSPFQSLDTASIGETVRTLFTEGNGEAICEYLRYRGRVAEIDQAEIAFSNIYYKIDREYMRRMETVIEQVTGILRFFDQLADDLQMAHRRLAAFASRLDEAERLDEAHLLPLALEIFGTPELPRSAQYVSALKTRRSKGICVSRRLSFDRFYSFVVSDFFEGLHYGHYLRRCPICRSYFLMQSARRQKYCSTGYAPALYRGKRLPCRKYAAAMHRKELAENDPVIDLYNRRCAAIRAEKSRGVITPAFAETARLLAQDRKYLAMENEQYAATQYEIDMTRPKLYADARARCAP